jgi:hypothetical protein
MLMRDVGEAMRRHFCIMWSLSTTTSETSVYESVLQEITRDTSDDDTQDFVAK